MGVRAAWVVLLIPVLAFAGSIENTQHLELSIKNIQSMHIICGPGSLDVFGVERSDRIKVAAAVKISVAPNGNNRFTFSRFPLIDRFERLRALETDPIWGGDRLRFMICPANGKDGGNN